jgi:hypothetical protein
MDQINQRIKDAEYALSKPLPERLRVLKQRELDELKKLAKGTEPAKPDTKPTPKQPKKAVKKTEKPIEKIKKQFGTKPKKDRFEAEMEKALKELESSGRETVDVLSWHFAPPTGEVKRYTEGIKAPAGSTIEVTFDHYPTRYETLKKGKIREWKVFRSDDKGQSAVPADQRSFVNQYGVINNSMRFSDGWGGGAGKRQLLTEKEVENLAYLDELKDKITFANFPTVRSTFGGYPHLLLGVDGKKVTIQPVSIKNNGEYDFKKPIQKTAKQLGWGWYVAKDQLLPKAPDSAFPMALGVYNVNYDKFNIAKLWLQHNDIIRQLVYRSKDQLIEIAKDSIEQRKKWKNPPAKEISELREYVDRLKNNQKKPSEVDETFMKIVALRRNPDFAKDLVGREQREISSDLQRKALPAGKRISKTGKVYYENRPNRTDSDRRRKI